MSNKESTAGNSRAPRRELRKPPFAETDVLTISELCLALQVSRTTVFRVLRKLPVSYGLGEKTPRVIWGDMLQYLRETRLD
jgi:hypothetical protein